MAGGFYFIDYYLFFCVIKLSLQRLFGFDEDKGRVGKKQESGFKRLDTKESICNRL